MGTGRSVRRCSLRFLWLPVAQVEVVARTHGYWNELRQVYEGARDGLPAALGTKELRMLKQPPDFLVSTVVAVRAPDLVLQVIEHGGSAQTSRSDGEAETDVGGGKTKAAAAVRVVGRGAIVPPSHAGADSISHNTHRVTLATKRRMPRRSKRPRSVLPDASVGPRPGHTMPRLATALPQRSGRQAWLPTKPSRHSSCATSAARRLTAW
jgi:hypothetical protein